MDYSFAIIPTTIAELTNALRESGIHTEDVYFLKSSEHCQAHAKKNPRNGDHPARRQLAARRDLPRFAFIFFSLALFELGGEEKILHPTMSRHNILYTPHTPANTHSSKCPIEA